MSKSNGLVNVFLLTNFSAHSHIKTCLTMRKTYLSVLWWAARRGAKRLVLLWRKDEWDLISYTVVGEIGRYRWPETQRFWCMWQTHSFMESIMTFLRRCFSQIWLMDAGTTAFNRLASHLPQQIDTLKTYATLPVAIFCVRKAQTKTAGSAAMKSSKLYVDWIFMLWVLNILW